MTGRDQALSDFLAATGWRDRDRAVLADDASFRRYDRLRDGWRRAVLMDAPPDKEDTRPFIRIAGILRDAGLSAPEVIAQDVENGFLLLEDLGDDTFTKVLAAGGDEATLYAQALEALAALYRRVDLTALDDLPRYDEALYLREVSLLTDWYLPAIRGPLDDSVRESFVEAWRSVLPTAAGVPSTLVLRDYHVDNLMWLPERESPACVGLLDFQDGVVGPVTYDLVSLFEDARRDVSPAVTARLLDRYLGLFPDIDRTAFEASYAVLAAQRSTKILGIFTRLAHRDGKPGYLRHTARLWRWLEADLRHPALAPVKDWFDREVPAEMRREPPAEAA
ncbi:aminoglycoside phosphotransferase family protein [Hwanghaeella sp.]|uniref:aminoglycoside phosphotransferase family protein n=1 Tax=Hwanghaeella sp. TaxID=2605943 RepID=UPI003CCBCED9